MNYNFLTDKSRLASSVEFPWLCDKDAAANISPGWRGDRLWYKFSGAASSYMADTPPGIKHCKTNSPGWISTPLPTEPNQSYNATFCFQTSDSNCANFVHGKVTNCKDFFVYQLPDIPAHCSMRYCSSFTPSVTIKGISFIVKLFHCNLFISFLVSVLCFSSFPSQILI